MSQTDEDAMDDEARKLILKQGITYQEAIKIVKNKQKNLFDF